MLPPDRLTLVTKIKYWLQKQSDTQWQWGHPDEWSDAEWHSYKKENKDG